MTANNQRSSGSTGARISTGKFSPSSPKGGFGSSLYEAIRAIDDTYGYRSESYYRQRLFGNKASDIRWRYDLNKKIIGRPDYQSRVSFPWLPRFPKKKWTKTTGKDFQENSKVRTSKFQRRVYKRPAVHWCNLNGSVYSC